MPGRIRPMIMNLWEVDSEWNLALLPLLTMFQTSLGALSANCSRIWVQGLDSCRVAPVLPHLGRPCLARKSSQEWYKVISLRLWRLLSENYELPNVSPQPSFWSEIRGSQKSHVWSPLSSWNLLWSGIFIILYKPSDWKNMLNISHFRQFNLSSSPILN